MKRKVESVYLTKDKDSIFCGARGVDVGQKVNVEAINKFQRVQWEINTDILHLLSDKLKEPDWKNPNPPSALELKEREKAFILRDKETNDVIDYLLENGNKFYFNWKYDARGRSYCQGYHINIQGNEYRKAMLRFSNKELLTEEGIYYLKIDIANTMGYDKLTWLERIVRANAIISNTFYKVINDNKYERDFASIEEAIVAQSKEADSPLLFIKAMFAYYHGVILGKPIGHNMSLDSTASGLQIMAALSGCCITARNCNVHAKIERVLTEEAAEKLSQLEAELASLKEK